MKRKITVCILLLAMLITVTACGKSNEDSDDDSSAKDELVPKHTYVDGACTDCGQREPSEGLEFEEITDGKRNVIGYAVSGIGTCTDTDLVLPDEHNGLPCLKVYYDSFAENENIVSVTIPEGYESICGDAFYDCVNLKKVSLPSTLKEIGGGAFMRSGIEEITLPEGLELIGSQAFDSCSNLKTINLPSTLLELEYMAFQNCTALSEVTFSEGATTIGDFVFYKCYSLKKVVLPVSLTSIGGGTFNYCPSLTNIVYNGTVEQFKAIDCEAISNAHPIKCTDGSIDDYWTGKEK